jgi:hypothetical protein
VSAWHRRAPRTAFISRGAAVSQRERPTERKRERGREREREGREQTLFCEVLRVSV